MRNAKHVGWALGWAFVLSIMMPICANAIVFAWYGDPASTATIGNGRVDVTSSLNKMIINNVLTLPAGADTYNSLFTNPAEGIAKVLHIEKADKTIEEFAENTTARIQIPVVAAPVAPVKTLAVADGAAASQFTAAQSINQNITLGAPGTINVGPFPYSTNYLTLPVDGSGVVRFTASGNNDIWVVLTSTTSLFLENSDSRVICIGGWGNTNSAIGTGYPGRSNGDWSASQTVRRDASSPIVRDETVDPSAMISSGTASYWVKLENGTLSWGKRSAAGLEEMKQSFPGVTAGLKYVFFGTNGNITITGAQSSAVPITSAPVVSAVSEIPAPVLITPTTTVPVAEVAVPVATPSVTMLASSVPALISPAPVASAVPETSAPVVITPVTTAPVAEVPASVATPVVTTSASGVPALISPAPATPAVPEISAPIAPATTTTVTTGSTPVVTTSAPTTPALEIPTVSDPAAVTTSASGVPALISPAPQPSVMKLANIPADFVLEGGTAQDIAVGSKNGELVAYALGLDGQMYMYQPNSLSAVPWVKQTAVDQNNNPIFGFKDLSMSSDGVLCAISDIGKAYVYYWQQRQFMEVPAGIDNEDLFFDKISVGNVNNVWAVNEASKNIYQLGPNGWELRAENAGVFVAAGYDGLVFGINDQGDVFKYNPAITGWTRYPGVKLSFLALGSSDFVYGTYKNGDVYELWQLVNNVWQRVLGADGQPAIGIDEIAVNAAGTIFAIDYAGNIYNKGNLGIAVTVPSSITVVSAPTSVGTLTSDPVVVNAATSKPVTKVSTATTARKVAKTTGKVATTVKKTAKLKKSVKTKAPAPKKSTAKTTAKKAKATTSTTAKKPTTAKAATPIAVKATAAAATATTAAAKAKTAVKKVATKKAPVAKATTAKKVAAKKTTAAAKKPAAKKPAAKKPAAKKPAAKKPAAKKPAAKKPAAKKPAAKKTAAKKVTATATPAAEVVE